MISLPGSLSFVMSSAPAKSLRGMPDARPKNHPSIESRLSHTISTPTRIRSVFFLRRTQPGHSVTVAVHVKVKINNTFNLLQGSPSAKL